MGSIPLVASTIRPPEQQDMAGNYGRILALKNELANAPLQHQILQQQSQTGQLNLQQQQQAQAEHDAAMKIIQESNGDIRSALPKLMQVSPTAAIKWQQDLMTSDQTAIKTKQEIIKYHQDQTGRIAQLAGSVTDPQSYQAAIQQAVNEQLMDPQTAQQYLQQGYDPVAVKGMQQKAISAKEQLEEADKALTAQETARHNKETENKPSEAMQGLNDFIAAKTAAKGAPLTAQEGLAARQEYYQRNKSQTNVFGSTGDNDIKDTAQMIKEGQAPPVLTEYSFRDRTKIAGELHREGYNLAAAEMDWKATQKFLQTANGAQQTRLRQAITALPDLTDKIEGLYNEWSKIAPTSGFKVLNKASLAAMKNLPGRPGAVAQALDAQIADAVSDLAVVYMGGNSPTDHGLALAQKNLSADWNDTTFKEGLKQLKLNAQIRKNSLNVGPIGVSSGSQYPVTNGPVGSTPAQGNGSGQQGSDPFSQFGGKAH